jgi:hypothetical protein
MAAAPSLRLSRAQAQAAPSHWHWHSAWRRAPSSSVPAAGGLGPVTVPQSRSRPRCPPLPGHTPGHRDWRQWLPATARCHWRHRASLSDARRSGSQPPTLPGGVGASAGPQWPLDAATATMPVTGSGLRTGPGPGLAGNPRPGRRRCLSPTAAAGGRRPGVPAPASLSRAVTP